MESDWKRLIEERIINLESEVKVLTSMKNYVLGGVAVMSAFLGFFAKQIAVVFTK